jgi:hypothetical protein
MSAFEQWRSVRAVLVARTIRRAVASRAVGYEEFAVYFRKVLALVATPSGMDQ